MLPVPRGYQEHELTSAVGRLIGSRGGEDAGRLRIRDCLSQKIRPDGLEIGNAKYTLCDSIPAQQVVGDGATLEVSVVHPAVRVSQNHISIDHAFFHRYLIAQKRYDHCSGGGFDYGAKRDLPGRENRPQGAAHCAKTGQRYSADVMRGRKHGSTVGREKPAGWVTEALYL